MLHLTFSLFSKDDSAHLEDTLETLLALDCILLEPRDQSILDLVLDALPAAAEGGDSGALHELGLVVAKGRICDLFLDVDEVAPSQILAHHGDGSIGRVDIAGLVYPAVVHVAADDGLEPVRGGLLAGDEAFGAEDAGGRVDLARDGVYGDDMFGLVVPGAIFLPVC